MNEQLMKDIEEIVECGIIENGCSTIGDVLYMLVNVYGYMLDIDEDILNNYINETIKRLS